MDNYKPFKFDFIGDYAVYQGVYLERSFTISQALATVLAGRSIVMNVRKSSGGTELILQFKTSDNTIVLVGLTLTIKMSGALMNIEPTNYVFNMDSFNTAADNIKIMVGSLPILPKV